MANANKAKGSRFESEVRDYLQVNGHDDAHRVVQTGKLDTGDLKVHNFTLQAKNWANLSGALSAGTDGAMVQSKRAGSEFGAAVIKRPRKGVKEAYVVMPLHQFVHLLNRLPYKSRRK